MAVKRGLGRGLNSLLSIDEEDIEDAKSSVMSRSSKTKAVKSGAASKSKSSGGSAGTKNQEGSSSSKAADVEQEVNIKITDIEPNPNQPRTNFDEDALNELAESIKKVGVIEPLIVQRTDHGYEIIAGERRWRAARIAGLKEIPVIVRKYTRQQRVEVALIENIQREDLNPVEEALAYKRLIEEFNLKQDEVAERVSKSRTAITNSLRLLKLSDKVQQMLIDQMLSAGHARCLISIEDPDVQYETAMTIFDQGLSVRDAEQLVKDVNSILAAGDKDESKKKDDNKEDNAALTAILSQIENSLKASLGAKVKIRPKDKNKGRIEIEYFSNDDLERIVHVINSTKE